MLELAIRGSKKYYGWLMLLLGIIGIGFLFYLKQLEFGLGLTGMTRDCLLYTSDAADEYQRV